MKKYETFITVIITAPLVVAVAWICLAREIYLELLTGILMGIFSVLLGMKRFERWLEARARKAKTPRDKGMKIDGRKSRRLS
jgi:membrane protein implicated in regulation of membrane protease activity